MTLSDEEIERIVDAVLRKLSDALRMNRGGAMTRIRGVIEPLDAIGVTDLRTGKVTIRET